MVKAQPQVTQQGALSVRRSEQVLRVYIVRRQLVDERGRKREREVKITTP